MKQFFQITLLASMLALTFNACGSEDNNKEEEYVSPYACDPGVSPDYCKDGNFYRCNPNTKEYYSDTTPFEYYDKYRNSIMDPHCEMVNDKPTFVYGKNECQPGEKIENDVCRFDLKSI